MNQGSWSSVVPRKETEGHNRLTIVDNQTAEPHALRVRLRGWEESKSYEEGAPAHCKGGRTLESNGT